jgi:hypothetical protein
VNVQRIPQRKLAKPLMKRNILRDAGRRKQLHGLVAAGHVQGGQQARQPKEMIAVQN